MDRFIIPLRLSGIVARHQTYLIGAFSKDRKGARGQAWAQAWARTGVSYLS